jgi:hypothetical protein
MVNWRIPICTRYRQLIVVALALGVWTLSIFLGSAIQRNQREAWDAKLANVKVGTARARLVKILGEPQRTERIGSDQGLWLRESSSEESEKIKSEHKVLVAYFYEKTFFGTPESSGYVVYLDENEGRALFKPYLGFFGGTGPDVPYKLILLSFLVISVALVWLLFRTWCARQIRKSRAVSGSDRAPEK